MDSEKPLSSEQRLAIIEQMINTAKGNITDSSFHFLLWGWVVAFANIGHYSLSQFSEYKHPELIWLICIPAAITSFIYGRNQGKNSNTRTYTDRISMWLWIAIFPCLIIIIMFGYKTNFMISPLIMLITGYATFQSGIIIKFKPLIIGGLVFWCASILGFMSSYENQALISAIAVVLGYLIPGYILKQRVNNG